MKGYRIEKRQSNETSSSSAKEKFVFVVLLLIPVLLQGPLLNASSLWKYANHRGLKLTGRILIADEKGTHWDKPLPPEWTWLKNSKKPGKYYMSIGRITPETENGKLIFQISRWNFINSALQDGFSKEFILRKLQAIRKDPILRFREDAAMSEARSEFEALSEKDLTGLFDEPRKRVDFSLSAKGVVVFTTSRKKLMKIFTENYSTSGYITAMEIPSSSENPYSPAQQLFIENLQFGWSIDFDKDGLIDITWDPISHIRSSGYEVRSGQKIALFKIYEK